MTDAKTIFATDRWRGLPVRRIPPVPANLTLKQSGRRRGCGDVAWNRAVRYARRRRIRRALWPLIAAAFLIGLVFERQPFPALARQRKAAPDGGRMLLALMPGEDLDIDRVPDPDGAGGTAGGIREPRYRPPADFLAKDKEVAQIVTFLIRNRSRLDNDAVRAKWELLDRAALPLAIYLREIEAASAWDDLEKEVSATPPGMPTVSRSDLPKSIRHRKLLRLMPDWVRRGEDLLTGGGAVGASPNDAPTLEGDDGPDTRPRKP